MWLGALFRFGRVDQPSEHAVVRPKVRFQAASQTRDPGHERTFTNGRFTVCSSCTTSLGFDKCVLSLGIPSKAVRHYGHTMPGCLLLMLDRAMQPIHVPVPAT